MKNYCLVFISVVLFSCTNPNKGENTASKKSEDNLTASHIELSPDSVIRILKNGNRNFYTNKLTPRNDSIRRQLTSSAQFPKAVVLSCIDSRIATEDIFDQGIGDLAEIKIAGNFANKDILGSLEYACNVSGAKVIFVMGHEHCGAIKAAIDHTSMGNITSLLNQLKPAVDMVKTQGKRTSENDSFVHDAAKENVLLTIEKIRNESEILNKMEQHHLIKIVGGMYDLSSGKITFY